MELEIGDTLMKVGLFIVVQALVYLILTQSSTIFSKNRMRSLSFKTARSVSIRRFMAALQDLPAGGEPSPPSTSPNKQDLAAADHDHRS